MMNKDLQKTTWQKAMYLIFPVISIGLLMMAWLMVSTNRPDLFPGPATTWERFRKLLVKPLGENPFMGTYSGQPAPRGDCSGPVLFFRNYFWGDDGMEPVF